MRGATLTATRAKLKYEIRDAALDNTAADAEYNQLLVNKQNELADAYDWQVLRREWNLSITAGTTRYYTLPTTDVRGATATINFNRPVQVDVFFNDSYLCVDSGIGTAEYNYMNSDQGEQLDPIRRWDFATNLGETSNANQIEVWPLPLTTQTLRFSGQRVVNSVSTGTDKFDLDDLLLVYMVAADYLLFREHTNASIALKRANDYLIRLRSAEAPKSAPVVLGKSDQQIRNLQKSGPIITVA